MKFSHNETLPRALKFVENFHDKHPSISNLYVFTSVDKDGNIIDEKYGMNLMTTAGFTSIYLNGSSFVASESVGLYVGNGGNDITVESSSMQSAVFGGLKATNSDVSISSEFPMYFSASDTAGMGLITTISKFLTCYYPVNVPNYPEDTYISEYGIGTGINALWTHSHIYNVAGQKDHITKYNNTTLYINVYVCMSFYESLIQGSWVNGKFPLITTNNIMFSRMVPNKIYTYKRDGVNTDRTQCYTLTVNSVNPNAFTNSIIMPDFIINQTGDTNNGFIAGFALKHPGMTLLEPEVLPTPEELVITGFTSRYPWKYDGFSAAFGYSSNDSLTKHPPITHLITASSNLYDMKSGTWTNTLDYYNSSNKYYDDVGSSTNFSQPIYYYSSAGEIRNGYVFQNLHPEDAITAVVTGGISVYATNKYWYIGDPGSNTDPDKGWVWIRNYNNIPANCRSARFWIVNTNAEDLIFVRQIQPYQLYVKGTNANGCSVSTFESETGWSMSIDNPTHGCFVRGSTLFVPASNVKRSLSLNTYTSPMSYGRWICTFNNPCTGVKCIDVNNPASASPITDLSVTWQNSDTGSNTYKTETGTGYLAIQSNGASNTCQLIDITGATPTITSKPWKHVACIYGTNYVAYTLATDQSSIYIYDCSSGTNVGSAITNPVTSNTKMMIGNGTHLWIVGSSAMYVADLSASSRPTYECTNSIPSGIYNSLNNVRLTSIPEGTLVYHAESSYNLSNTMFCRTDNPTQSSRLPDGFNSGGSPGDTGNNVEYRLVIAQDATIAGVAKRSIALVITVPRMNSSSTPNGSDNRAFDFGQYLAAGTVAQSQTYSSKYSYCSWIVLGNKIVHEMNYVSPIINYMPIKLVCTTDTISSFNVMKKLSGKSWDISYGNTPLWGDEITGSGIPPGVPTARTDISGQITGWS